MSWTVFVEDEEGQAISLPSLDLKNELNLSDIENYRNAFRLLKYLDPYGDTVLNRLQMKDLIYDLQKLMAISDQRIVSKLIDLAWHCQNNPHTYLRFCGD